MSAIKTTWTTADGIEIFGQYWWGEGAPKAVVCLVHGLGEHCGRYDHVAAALNENGYALYAFDHRGHGRSTGARGHIPNFEALMEEIDLVMAQAQQQFPDVPLFLYGHSWGGNITANYLIRKKPEINGAIITGAWLKLQPDPPAMKVFLAKLVNPFWPSYAESNGIRQDELSSDLSVGEAYVNDPLVHDKVSARLFLETTAAAGHALQNGKEVEVPVLLMHGREDKITSHKGTEQFAASVKSEKQLIVWEGMRHEIHNEKENGKVLAEIVRFLDAHAGA